MLCRLYTFWCSILFSRQRSFFFLYYCCITRMYLRFRGCPVVLDIELSVSAWYQKTRRVPLRARRLLLLLLLLAAERGGVRHNLENFMQNKTTILCQSEHAKTPPHPKHTHVKEQFFLNGNSLYGPASWKHTNGDMSDMPSQQPTEQPRTSPPRWRVSEHMPRRPSCVCLPECSVSRAMATGALEA